MPTYANVVNLAKWLDLYHTVDDTIRSRLSSFSKKAELDTVSIVALSKLT